MSTKLDASVYSKMQVGEPLKVYKKTILARAYVTILNPFSGEPEGLVLSGDPSRNEPGCLVEIWSEAEDAFFKRMNSKHLQTGVIIPIAVPIAAVKTEEEVYNTLPDEELERILTEKFFTLQNALNKMTSEAAVYRVLAKANEMEKSEKVVNAIEARLSELQSLDFKESQE